MQTYKGDVFRNLIKQYSFDRMERDPAYRRAVRAAKIAKKAARHSKVASENVNASSSISRTDTVSLVPAPSAR